MSTSANKSTRRTGGVPKTTEHHEQYIFNLSFDTIYNLLMMGMLLYNPDQTDPDTGQPGRYDRAQIDDATGGMKVTTVGSAATQKRLIDKTTTTNVIYIGVAPIGSGTGSNVWRIQKVDKTTSPISITWAAAGASTATWNNRATTETYS